MANNIIYIIISLLGLNYLFFLIRVFSGLTKLNPNSNHRAIIQNKIEETKIAPDLFISIIIPFYNEKNNILNSLKSLSNQNIPKDNYEVIYVNDNSSDSGDTLLEENIKSENVFMYSCLQSDNNKKAAIEYGISKAKGDIIVLSDADCVQQPDWVKSMLMHLDEETGFVAGPVEFYSDSSVFSKLQQLEFAGLIIVGAGLIGSRMPAICNGANILFRKKLFYQVNGYQGNKDIASGDDVFLMQKIAKNTIYKIRFCNSTESIVRTYPQKTLKKFFSQRKRWAGKSIAYIDKNLISLLSLVFFFYLGLFISPIFIIRDIDLLGLFGVAILLKVLIEFIVLKKGSSVIPLTISFRYFLLAELLHIPYILFSTIYGIFSPKKWEK